MNLFTFYINRNVVLAGIVGSGLVNINKQEFHTHSNKFHAVVSSEKVW